MLTKSNYAAWAIKMEVFMMAQGVWDAVESPGPVDKRRDKMALAAIYQGIGEDTLLQLGAKKTAKEAWNMLKTMNQGADKVKEVRTQTLWREFEALRMSDSENVDDFSGKLTIIVNKLRSLGNTVEDEKVVKKLLRSVSSKFLQIASTIEEFSDLTTKSIEEVIGSLKAHEERLLSCGGRSDETVLLTRAEWKAREEAKKNKGKSKETTSSRGGRGRGRGRGRNSGSHQRKEEEPQQQRKKFDKSKIKCYGCGKMGHFASECSSKEKEEQANLTERDDEEQSLLMIETCELNGQSYGQIYFEEPSLMMIDAVELNGVQGEAYVAATSGCLMKGAGWYLDTGATNHMTGDKHCFVEIDDSICGKVKFGDGSVIDIQGFGSVMFQCKNGEHLTLTNVYYIPKLKSNIISLGQIDESGGRILIECGALRVYDNSNRLIIKVRRQQNRLFIADLQIAEKKGESSHKQRCSFRRRSKLAMAEQQTKEESDCTETFIVQVKELGGAGIPEAVDAFRTPSTPSSSSGIPNSEINYPLIQSSSSNTTGTGSDSSSTPPRKFRSLQEIYNETREVDEEVGLCFLSMEEPTRYEEAVGDENWRRAMECPFEHALYMKKEEDDVTVVGVYVDDLILTGSNGKHIESFKQEMMRMFEMSDLGLLSYYLGIEVKQTPDCISLCQAGYASKILEKTGMLNCNSSRVPMEPKCKLKKQDGEPFVDATEYRRIIGSLRYLVNTRPDLAYSVGVVSRYMDTPTVTHMSAVKQILRYVRGTIGMGIVYKKNQEKEELVGFSDSDLAGDTDDRKSTSGIIFFFGESPITWVSHKQRIVALSSCEAEYIAATGGACQGIWLKKIIAELRGDDKVKPVLKIWSKSVATDYC
ncbi:hypothetical protein GH714_006270 [Hevea brasiliensis]|uniref:CCHC-type domain-containing protein n=1 Tax=Hevea brasiliensis TaxID=3981 RepID=A0A6A6N9V3_HEVBR|nr:hypothetical protein GH714_006270 [Hevea brasiliensis]